MQAAEFANDLLFGEQVVHQLGGKDDDADNGKNYQHANTHVLQIVDECHGVKLQIDGSIR